MRVTVRNLAIAGATVALVAATASAGFASRRHTTHVTNGVQTYSTGSTAPLATALSDPWLFNSSQREKAFALTRAAGAKYVRLMLAWSGVAPTTRPQGFVATDPTSPGYSWAAYDTIIEQAEAAGLTPILNVSSTPKWAYATKPKGVNGGTPKAAALGAFATALATHYDGTTQGTGTTGGGGPTGGGRTQGVPTVRIFQVWNEPNVSLYLDPAKPSVYRAMVNAFANSVHAVNPANLVVAGALDPFGHPKSKKQKWYSISPLTYMRSLLCLSKGTKPHATCRNPVHFDVWSHHPYTFGGAFGHAKNPNDVELGDLPKMRALLQAGIRHHRILSKHGVQFWVTEFSWDTKPPRRNAAPIGLASRWTAESLYQMWRSGVSVVTWFGLQDRGGPGPYKSGLFFHSGSLANARAKPVRTAFRFPFVAYLGRGSVSLWGRDATSNQRLVTIQLRHGKHWRTVAKVRSNRSGIFRANVRLKATRKDVLRAKAAGSGTSLPFSLTVPHAPHIGPWGS